MNRQTVSSSLQSRSSWCPPVRREDYDSSESLTQDEDGALTELLSSSCRWVSDILLQDNLERLITPLRDALASVDGNERHKEMAITAILRGCGRAKLSFWGWDELAWSNVLGTSQGQFIKTNGNLLDSELRVYPAAAGYLLGCLTDFQFMGNFKRMLLASKVFGHEAVEHAVTVVTETLDKWGYATAKLPTIISAISEALLLNHSPYLHDLSAAKLDEFRRICPKYKRPHYLQISKVLTALGVTVAPLDHLKDPDIVEAIASRKTSNIHPEWLRWINRWDKSTIRATQSRDSVRCCLYRVGCWLKRNHPEVTEPRQWTRELGTEYVAAVDRMKVGDYVTCQNYSPRLGQPLLPRSKDRYLGALRAFFRDLHEWGWIPRRFDPGRVFATPRSIAALIGPAPRTISDDIWARIMWAGLNLTSEDLFLSAGGLRYPLELVRALVVIWLFAGLRSDEIVRLRLGCIRWQRDEVSIQPTGEILPPETVCLLDVPVNKTGTAFTKPVDPVVGMAVSAWEQIRPSQPSLMDAKTGEIVEFLFCYRARILPNKYINSSLIPMLCQKAGVPLRDVRGNITSHRARATIASQLFNSREPMSLFELQAWLGHSSPATTRNYVAITPTKLAKAYADAGYLERNVRAIEVLIDNDAVKAATAATGEPWRYYDLGHCFCTYEFFDQCPHRMACARCDFCIPKDSNHAQLLEAKTNILRLLQEVPLTNDERAVADGDLDALDRLVAMLSDKPTPSGQTPKQLIDRG